ncbi:16S rRNA (guanine(966)-N(2))-methyltransferase RsmD [Pelagibacterales bacterium SAG-MED24]|nr:16S rRNA (guanine(966)-N(2))-methyltransferase RsmD [Pelagibacterales bacterium SAG-MED24]
MRIISGNFKGKKLFVPLNKNTRPLKDLVKESIFNLINHSKNINLEIENSLILDLFSGTGSFGVECLSRGARKVIFLENYPEALKILEKNLKSLKGISNYEIIQTDCFNFFRSDKKIKLNFDIIFIDPPYKEKKINEIIEKIKENNLLNEKGIVIIHRHKNDTIELTKKINIFEERFYGISKIYFGN